MDDLSDLELSRRRLLQLAGLAGLGLVLQACGRVPSPLPVTPTGPAGAGTALVPSPLPVSGVNGVNAGHAAPPPTPSRPGEIMVTSNDDFYTVASRSERPPVPAGWKLEMGGNVDRPLVLGLDDLKALPAVQEMRTLECISNPAGGPLISNALWKGFRLTDLLDRAGVKAGTAQVKFESFDGYSTAIPLDAARDDHSLLVYEMNGEPLPLEHGQPLRCLFPGRYGMKQPKWLTRITAIAGTYQGFWEKQGWSDEAFIRPNSRIDSPGEGDTLAGSTLTIQGIGFSREAGIATIEVSLDVGQTWHEAALTRGPSPLVWTSFNWSGPVPESGEYALYARVTDNRGAVQSKGHGSLLGSTFPGGTLFMQPVIVTVKKG